MDVNALSASISNTCSRESLGLLLQTYIRFKVMEILHLAAGNGEVVPLRSRFFWKHQARDSQTYVIPECTPISLVSQPITCFLCCWLDSQYWKCLRIYHVCSLQGFIY